MSPDGVNRNLEFEKEFMQYRRSQKGDSMRIEALWYVFDILKKSDLQKIHLKRLRMLQLILGLCEMHFELVESEKPYLEYTKWFFSNRLINTGSDQLARCQKSPLFKPLTYTPKK